MSRITLPHKPILGLKLMLCAALLAGLSACQDNDDSGPDGTGAGPTPATLTGTAAFGAPVSGGTVTAKCSNGSGFSSTVTTNAQGVFSGQVAQATLPCALSVSGGNLPAGYGSLHSLATAAGRTNVTPLTDLVLALAVNTAAGQSLAAWFANPANLPQVSGGLSTALAVLRTALNKAGYTIPATWTAGSRAPFSAAFDPDPAIDPYDALLEQLAAGLRSGTYEDYAAMLAALVAGADLPDAPEEEEPPATQPATVNGLLSKPFSLVFQQAGGAGCGSSCSFTNNQSVGAMVSANNNSLAIAAKTLNNPVNRRVDGTLNLAEIVWQDGEIFYALSNNQTGSFDKIRVERSNGNGGYEFLGQLVTASQPPGPSNALDAIKALAGSYDFEAIADATSNGDFTMAIPRGLRAMDGYPLCASIGVNPETQGAFTTPTLWRAKLVIGSDGSVSLRNRDNASQSVTLTPGSVSADDNTVASLAGPSTPSTWGMKNEGSNLYLLRRTVRYNDPRYTQPLSENFSYLLGVDAAGQLQSLEMSGSNGSPRMAFCGGRLIRSLPDALAPLKALAGSYTVKRNYRSGQAPWSSIAIGSDGAISFDGTGPNTGVAEIKRLQVNKRNDNSNSTDNSTWALTVYLDRDVNGDSTIDKFDAIQLFLTNDGQLRDVQHLTSSNQLVDVSVADRSLPAFDDTLAAALTGNGVSGKYNGGAQLVSSTQPNANVSVYDRVSRLSLVAKRDNRATVPMNEWKAWQVTVNASPPVAGTTYDCDSSASGSQGQETGVLFDQNASGLDTQSTPTGQTTGSSRVGGDCEIEVTRVVLSENRMRAAEGRFRAVLWNRDAKRYYDATGFFRYDPAP